MTEDDLKNYLNVLMENDEFIFDFRDDDDVDKEELWARLEELHEMCNKLLSVYFNEDAPEENNFGELT